MTSTSPTSRVRLCKNGRYCIDACHVENIPYSHPLRTKMAINVDMGVPWTFEINLADRLLWRWDNEVEECCRVERGSL